MSEAEKLNESLPEGPQQDEKLTAVYKDRGFQQMSWEEYKAQQEKNKSKKKFQVPTHVKFILGTPFLLLFCYGIFFIPWMLYLIATAPAQTEDSGEKTKIESKKFDPNQLQEKNKK